MKHAIDAATLKALMDQDDRPGLLNASKCFCE